MISPQNTNGLIDVQGKKKCVFPSNYRCNNKLEKKVSFLYEGHLKVGTGVAGSLEQIKYNSVVSGAPFVPFMAAKMIDLKGVGMATVPKESIELIVYPNPVGDNLYVKVNAEQIGTQASIILTDVTGRIINIEIAR